MKGNQSLNAGLHSNLSLVRSVADTAKGNLTSLMPESIPMNDSTIERISQKIEMLSDTALSLRSSYLLSELGKALGSDLATLKLLTKQTLGDFIRNRFSEKFSIVFTGKFGNVQALIRSPSSEPVVELPEHVSETVETQKASPRFNYRFWAAFSVPLKEGRRFLDLTDFKFQDITSEAVPEGHCEIPSSLIAPDGIKDRDKQIIANITKWIDENGFSKAEFIQVKQSREHAVASSNMTVLEAVISALEPKQLSTTTLTLEVVAALMRKRV